MAESHNLGQKGEDLAAEHLKKAGYKILFRNWKWGKHEIDIIAENKDCVVFVEVKTRSDELMIQLQDTDFQGKTEIDNLGCRRLY